MPYGKTIEMRYAGTRTKPLEARETRERDRSLAGKSRVRVRKATQRALKKAGLND